LGSAYWILDVLHSTSATVTTEEERTAMLLAAAALALVIEGRTQGTFREAEGRMLYRDTTDGDILRALAGGGEV
jgi:hypothetical protein